MITSSPQIYFSEIVGCEAFGKLLFAEFAAM